MTRLFHLICVLAVLTAGVALYVNGNASGRHLHGESCNSCHLTKDKVKPKNAHKLIATQEQLCGTCHSRATVASHPSGIIPSMHTPKDLPLDWKGELTCSTCHEVHGARQGLLRNKLRGRKYCLSCHEKGFFSQMSDMISTGHLDARPSEPGFAGILDSFSIQCLGCHAEEDGMMNVSVSAGGIVSHGSRNATHPVGREYSKAELYGGFRPAAMLPKYIVLPDGMVSCISCHQGYTRDHGKLVQSNEGSLLCFQCHDM